MRVLQIALVALGMASSTVLGQSKEESQCSQEEVLLGWASNMQVEEKSNMIFFLSLREQLSRGNLDEAITRLDVAVEKSLTSIRLFETELPDETSQLFQDFFRDHQSSSSESNVFGSCVHRAIDQSVSFRSFEENLGNCLAW